VPSDNRDLNYDAYFVEGERALSLQQDYTSDNARCLDEDELVELLTGLDYIQDELKGWRK
jgi:UDP-glucose 4-epimerase